MEGKIYVWKIMGDPDRWHMDIGHCSSSIFYLEHSRNNYINVNKIIYSNNTKNRISTNPKAATLGQESNVKHTAGLKGTLYTIFI